MNDYKERLELKQGVKKEKERFKVTKFMVPDNQSNKTIRSKKKLAFGESISSAMDHEYELKNNKLYAEL